MWLEHSMELKRFCEYKLSSCRDEVDDVIADAFYLLCVAVYENKIHTNSRNWLFTVTNNLIKKKYSEMNKRKRLHISFDEIEMEKYDCYNTDDESFFDSMLSDSVIECMNIDIINDLTPAENQLYKYVYKDKLRMKEIAQKMDLTLCAVKERNYRMSKKIKHMVKDHIENL